MLIENVISVFVQFAKGLFNGLADVNFLDEFVVNFNSVFDIFLDIMSGVLFFLPVNYLPPVLAVIFTVIGIRVLIALIKFILLFIPFMGG